MVYKSHIYKIACTVPGIHRTVGAMGRLLSATATILNTGRLTVLRQGRNLNHSLSQNHNQAGQAIVARQQGPSQSHNPNPSQSRNLAARATITVHNQNLQIEGVMIKGATIKKMIIVNKDSAT